MNGSARWAAWAGNRQPSTTGSSTRRLAPGLGELHSADCLLRSLDFAETEQLQRQARWDDAGRRLAAEAQGLTMAGAKLFVLCTNFSWHVFHRRVCAGDGCRARSGRRRAQSTRAPRSGRSATPRRAALGLDAADLTRVKERAKGDLRVLGLRFTADRGCPAERFQTLRRELGESFESIEIDSSPGNRHGIPQQAHSVLTVDLVDQAGHPTRAARDRVIAFLDERLHR